MRGEYSTKQKSLVLDYLRENSAHVTVADIVSGLKLQGVSIGTATVYRALERLCQSGEVRKFVIDEKSGACYQYARGSECANHFHLKCIGCGKLIHLSCDFLAEMEKHIYRDHAFTVSSGKTVIYGTCSDCSEGRNEENHANNHIDCECQK